MLTEKTRQTVVTGAAKKGNCVYNVEYRLNDDRLTRLICNVHQTVQETVELPGGDTQTAGREEYLGYLINESGNVQISLRENVDIMPHLKVFNEILEEVKGEISGEQEEE